MKRKIIRKLATILSTTLVVGGVAVIVFSALQFHRANIDASRDYLPAMHKIWTSETTTSESLSSQALPAATKTGTYLGVVEISSLKVKVNLFEGTESSALSHGAGHYRASVMPGESDNSVIAGHRDTVFSSLGKIKTGASIVITTRDGTFTYLVTSRRIVDKNDRTVIVPSDSATVTLSTCYPFRFMGSAPQRFIVTALMVPHVL